VRFFEAFYCWGALPVESRRLEDQIREWCIKAVATPDLAEFNEVIQQLREALREHTKRLRQLAAGKPPSPERRNHS
jgi:predicted membrane chloride channel (bestrophin family)